MLPAPFFNLIYNAVRKTAVGSLRRNCYSKRDIAEGRGRDKLQTGQTPCHRMDLPFKIPVRPRFCQVKRLRGAAVGDFILSDHLGFVDMSQGNIGKWG